MAFASPHITAYAVEATEFPDLARRYKVTGVPKTVVDDEVEILGALPQDAFVEQAIAKFTISRGAAVIPALRRVFRTIALTIATISRASAQSALASSAGPSRHCSQIRNRT
jgi:hypothetical protein